MAHNQRARIAIGDKSIICPAVDLHLILIEAVDKIARFDAKREIESFGIVDGKGCVRQVHRM